MPEEAVLDAPAAVSEPVATEAVVTEAAPELTADEIHGLDPVVEPEKPIDHAAPIVAAKPGEVAVVPVEPPKPDGDLWDGSKGVQILTKQLEGSPDLKAALDKNPALKNFIYANAASRDIAAAFEKVVFSPAQAQEAVDRSVRLSEFESRFETPGPDSARAFLLHLMDATKLIGPDGKPVLKDGKEQFSGRFNELAEVMAGDRYEQIRTWAVENKREDLAEAIDSIIAAEREMAGISPKTDPKTLPADVRAQLEQAESARLQAAERDKEGKLEYEKQVQAGIQAEVKKAQMPYLKRIAGALPEKELDAIFAEAFTEFGKLAMSNGQFRLSHNRLTSTAKGPEGIEAVAKLVANTSSIMRGILSQKVRARGEALVAKSKDTHQTLDQRAKASTEPKGAGAAAPPAKLSVEQAVTQAQQLKAELFKKGLVPTSHLSTYETMQAADGSLAEKFRKQLAGGA